MAVLEILKFPDPKLREISSPVQEIDDEIRKLVEDMKETMYAADGAGIAAIQVGKAARIFVIDAFIVSQDRKDEPIVFVNPEIVSQGGKVEGEEGCLSFPGVYVPISRTARCTVRARDLNDKEFEMTGEGLLSRAFQHEMDHIDGKLLIDYVGRLKKKFIAKKLKKGTLA